MPRVPGVPTLDPVNLPTESPSEAGRAGEAISSLGASGQDAALTGLDLDLFLKKAQERVDVIAAGNELQAADDAYQLQLKKTQNSRDIPSVMQSQNSTLNEIAKRWSTSPASVAIQMNADSLRSRVELMGQGRQYLLMGDEGRTQLKQQSLTLTQDYAGAMALGDTAKASAAQATYYKSVDSLVQSNLIGDVEANDIKRQFRQDGQELQIKNAITNASPEVNQKVYDQITQHREMFPDVPQEALDTYKGQALEAVESHIKYQDWAEGQSALRTQLVPKIQQFTNPANGRFDEAGALTDNADRLARGEITETQSQVLAAGFNSHATQLNVGLKQQAEKTKNDVVDLFHKNEYTQASAMLAAHKDDPEFEDFYEGLTKYGDQVQRERRAEGREELFMEKQISQEQSSETLGNILSALAQGHTFTDAQMYGMAGEGKGKMKSSDVMEAIRASKAYESDPNTQAAVKLLNDSFPVTVLPRTATAQEVAAAATPNARQTKRMALTYQQWQERVNQNPTEDKVAAMKDVLQPAVQEQISDQINQLFGAEAPKKSISDRIGGFFSSLIDPAPGSPGAKKEAAAQAIVQHSPSTGKDRYSTDGGKTWHPGKPPQ